MSDLPEFPLERFTLLPSNGWLKEDEARLLWDAASRTEGPILEVGCYHGRSTCLLALLGRPVVCVDPFRNFDSDDPSGEFAHGRFLRNVRERGLDNVALFRAPVEEWIDDWHRRPDVRCSPDAFGFAYLDGDHTFQGTLNQIDAALAVGARSMCLHDYDVFGGGREIKLAVESRPLDVVRVAGRMAHCVAKEKG